MSEASSKLTKAFRLPELQGGGSERMTIMSLIASDDPSERATPRLPEVPFAKRTLPGELKWPMERLPRRDVE